MLALLDRAAEGVTARGPVLALACEALGAAQDRHDAALEDALRSWRCARGFPYIVLQSPRCSKAWAAR